MYFDEPVCLGGMRRFNTGMLTTHQVDFCIKAFCLLEVALRYLQNTIKYVRQQLDRSLCEYIRQQLE